MGKKRREAHKNLVIKQKMRKKIRRMTGEKLSDDDLECIIRTIMDSVICIGTGFEELCASSQALMPVGQPALNIGEKDPRWVKRIENGTQNQD